MTVYSDRQYEIHKLTHTPGYEIIVEIFKEGRIIAALFQFRGENNDND